MNNETPQSAVPTEYLKQRKLDILAEIDRLNARLGEIEAWLRRAGDPAGGHWLIAQLISEPLPVLTSAEESAARERALKAHADELAKGNKALDEAITQVERKNGKPKRDTYGLIPGRTYKQSEIASKERWGWTWGRKLSQARQLGYIKTTSTHQPFVYEADALIEWRNMGAPYKKPKVAKVKK